jgi:hypothetical protein
MEEGMLNQKNWEGILGLYLGKKKYVAIIDDNQFEVSAAKLLDFITKELKRVRQL